MPAAAAVTATIAPHPAVAVARRGPFCPRFVRQQLGAASFSSSPPLLCGGRHGSSPSALRTPAYIAPARGRGLRQRRRPRRALVLVLVPGPRVREACARTTGGLSGGGVAAGRREENGDWRGGVGGATAPPTPGVIARGAGLGEGDRAGVLSVLAVVNLLVENTKICGMSSKGRTSPCLRQWQQQEVPIVAASILA